MDDQSFTFSRRSAKRGTGYYFKDQGQPTNSSHSATLAPTIPPPVPYATCTSMNLPNLEELSFRTVLAFPKASSIGEASRICSWTKEWVGEVWFRYERISFVVSVLPAPLSPLQERVRY